MFVLILWFSPLLLKRHIAYTTACCYRTSRDCEQLPQLLTMLYCIRALYHCVMCIIALTVDCRTKRMVRMWYAYCIFWNVRNYVHTIRRSNYHGIARLSSLGGHRCLGDGSPPARSRGGAPVGFWERSLQKADIYSQFAAVKCFSTQVCCRVRPPSLLPPKNFRSAQITWPSTAWEPVAMLLLNCDENWGAVLLFLL